jgi:ATPase family AAA domain-containing protein 3A/B
VTDLLTDTTKLATGIAGVTLLALGIYSTREGVRVAGKTFDRWFGTPRLVGPIRKSLLNMSSGWCTFRIAHFSSDELQQNQASLQVRETSRRGWGRGKGTAQGSKSLEAVKRDFSDVVLPRSLHDNVRSLAAVTANTRQHGAPFRHMMFYGGLLCHQCSSAVIP